MEVESFQCGTCLKTVPLPNRTIHLLYCDRAASARPPPSSPGPDASREGAGKVREVTPSANGDVSVTEVANVPAADFAGAAVAEEAAKEAAEVVSFEEVAEEAAEKAGDETFEEPAEEAASIPSVTSSAPPVPAPGSTTTTVANEADSTSFLVECEYCDLPVLADQLDAHSTQCGARTDVCELCLNYVRLRDMRRHKDSGCTILSTGSAMRSALSDGFQNENQPLLGNPQDRVRVRGRPEATEVADWAPVAVAVGAVAAAAAVSMLVRRR